MAGLSPPSLLLGVLRVSVRLANNNYSRISSAKYFLNYRSFSSLNHRPIPPPSGHFPIPIATPVYTTFPNKFPVLIQCRSFTLASLFTRNKPEETPSVATVADISRLEADANAALHDVQKQVVLFHALMSTKAKAGYNSVINRWEKMCEFDPTSPLLRSDNAFQMYITSLVESGHDKSVYSAARRRDSLLATTTTVASSPSPPSESPVNSDSASPSPMTTGTASTSLSSSRSQEIAQSVISGRATTPDVQFATALERGYGAPGGPPVNVLVTEPRGSWAYKSLKLLLATAFVCFCVIMVVATLMDSSGLSKMGPQRQSEFEPLQNKLVKFTDVHGVDEVKEELKDIVQFLKDPTRFASLGGKLPKGVLLTGPPGTGKTMLARAVAGEAGVPFFFASGSEFEEMFVGVGAKRVRELFAIARKKQPAIIFIDELDAVGGKRSHRDQQYMKQTLNQLLVEMDGFVQSEGVIVIAATNFPESLDSALTRPGRFDRVIAVPLPDIRGRVQILQHHMREIIASKEADTTILARGTPGFSGADLENLVNQAAIQASKEGFQEVMLSHFEWAKDRIIMGNERKSAYIDDKNKLMTAYHEGGHALALLYTDGAEPLHKVTCVPRGHALGVTSYLPENDQLSVSLKEYLARIDVCMGGRAAEAIVYGPENVTSGASSDLQSATRTATAMVKNYGFSQEVGPVYYSDREDTIAPKTKEKIDSEIRNILQAGEERVTALLRSKEPELHLLANALFEHETLNADEVRKVIKGEPIRNIQELIKEDLNVISTESTPES